MPERHAAIGALARHELNLDPSGVAGSPDGVFTIGVLPGEGIGPEVIEAALTVLRAVESTGAARFDLRVGGAIGREAIRDCGQELSQEVTEFCRGVFAAGGVVLAGPGGGRFVYDMRRRFDLFCKISPVSVRPELRGAHRLRLERIPTVDIVAVRENVGGIYQGEWSEREDGPDGRTAFHRFSYSQTQVERLLRIAAGIARERRGEMTLVVKPSGLPTISALWSDCAAEVARELDVRLGELEIDNAVYQLIQNPGQFDVVVSPNLFGDILSDVCGVLLGSRGLCYGGSFSSGGAAVYQTNHGAALDLASTDRANPCAQIFSLAMALRESFGLSGVADLIEAAVGDVWRRGWRTEDLRESGCRTVGTREMGRHVADAVVHLAGRGPESARSSRPERGAASVVLPAMAPDHGPGTAAGLEHTVHVSPRAASEPLWSVPICGGVQVAAASATAKRSLQEPRRRDRYVELLLTVADRVEAELEPLVRQMATEIGKPVRDARQEVTFGADLLRSAARRAANGGDSENGEGWRLRRRPLGVVGIITPWNNPLAIPLGKIAPALLYGNTVVWKPAPYGAAVAQRLLDLFLDVGLPPGAINLVQGDRTTAACLMSDAGIDAVTFTGSSEAGYDAQAICARRRIPFQAELGGNNAAIVWSDADLTRAAGQIAAAGMGSAGQRCTANRRVIVDRSCYGDFVDELREAIAALRFGDPLDDETHVGPVVSRSAHDRIAAAVDRARADGATMFVPRAFEERAAEWAERGFYYPPTLICSDDRSAQIVQEETFGPVIVVQAASGWDDAIGLCNGVRQGLVAALFTGSEDRRRRFLSEARAGLLKIGMATAGADAAAPFGGWKASGVGPPEHGLGDVDFYTRYQTLYEREPAGHDTGNATPCSPKWRTRV